MHVNLKVARTHTSSHNQFVGWEEIKLTTSTVHFGCDSYFHGECHWEWTFVTFVWALKTFFVCLNFKEVVMRGQCRHQCLCGCCRWDYVLLITVLPSLCSYSYRSMTAALVPPINCHTGYLSGSKKALVKKLIPQWSRDSGRMTGSLTLLHLCT